MDIAGIISSGLLELYAAGIASEQEVMEVERWLLEYPEVAEELKQISLSMEAYAQANAITPAADVKTRIFSDLAFTSDASVLHASAEPAESRGKVVDINFFWKMTAAAAAVLLIGSIALNIITYNRYNEADKNLVATRQTVGELQERNKVMAAGMDVVQNKYSVPIALKGLEASPGAAAKIFWIQNTGEVFIDPSNLPAAPQGKRYQLWGIVDGKPVDGGMIPNLASGEKYRIQKMKTFGRVEAFAVTLEPENGNPTPQGPMFVMGKM